MEFGWALSLVLQQRSSPPFTKSSSSSIIRRNTTCWRKIIKYADNRYEHDSAMAIIITIITMMALIKNAANSSRLPYGLKPHKKVHNMRARLFLWIPSSIYTAYVVCALHTHTRQISVIVLTYYLHARQGIYRLQRIYLKDADVHVHRFIPILS